MTSFKAVTRFKTSLGLRMTRFHREEDGSLYVFASFLFVLMFMMGGIAIDITRYEQTRVKLQNTLDRSVLAAASLSQDLDARDVVEDYFLKDGIASQLSNIDVIETANSKTVDVIGEADSQSMFMDMVGVESLAAMGRSTAEQSQTRVELVLVLDVSGSMAGTKIANLKTAASDFVSTVLAADENNQMSIAIVPYNGQVNLGAPLRSRYNATNLHGVADVNCLYLPPTSFTTTSISRTAPLPMAPFVDSYTPTSEFSGYLPTTDWWAQPYELNRWCPALPGNVVRMPNNNVATLQSQINGLTAIGATSINLGLKWGLNLLDPYNRPMFNTMVNNGSAPLVAQNRPYNFNDDGVMKIIVLMTDGAHFPEQRLNAGYLTGQSPIWRATDGFFSIRHSGRPVGAEFWVPHLGTWQGMPWGGWFAPRQTWQQVWGAQRLQWVTWQLYGRALGGTTLAGQQAAAAAALTAMRTQTESVTMDGQLQQVCALAKTQDVIIYGIAFEAPPAGEAQISACASSPAHYFPADGLEIAAAFSAIANNITQLKLTQ